MATLVLTSVGGLIGGPIGAAVGAALGGAIDREVLFKPAGREGPRLRDLAVQTSSYGTQIPKLFGTMRVAGSVIWATDLIEHRTSEGGGKGQPGTTRYSYTASFAVALSGRAIRDVRRIWADGKLLRGAAGDFKTRTTFRLHRGGEDQAIDPLIAAAEGIALTPAHRGIAYAVFEEMALGEYGNRIPALTFEVEADDGAVGTGAILEAIGEGALAGEAGLPVLAGFSVHGASIRAVAETLAGASGGWFAEEAGRLTMRGGRGATRALADRGARRGRAGGGRGVRSMAAADRVPRTVSLSHFDPARDYQTGVQRAVRPGAGSREMRVELPAVVDAGSAKTIAEAALARYDVERSRRTLSLGIEALDVRPGDRIAIGGVPGQWRVEQWKLEAMVVTLECVALAPATLPADASGGRVVAAPDSAVGETRIFAFELPPIDATAATQPQLAVAAAGTGPGWRGATILVSEDGGAVWRTAGGTALPATIGTIMVPPPVAPPSLEDRKGAIEVQLLRPDMMLADADAAALRSGANLAMVGRELVQFGDAVPLGGGQWRLMRLWRGRRGTDAFAGTQQIGEGFVLNATDTLARVVLSPSTLGGQAAILASGAADDAPAEAAAPIAGISVLPPSPVHLRARRGADGSVAVQWLRRSRNGWDWHDGIDAPLGEESEAYRVAVTAGGATIATHESATPTILLAPGTVPPGATIGVRQIGTHGLSPETTCSTIEGDEE